MVSAAATSTYPKPEKFDKKERKKERQQNPFACVAQNTVTFFPSS